MRQHGHGFYRCRIPPGATMRWVKKNPWFEAELLPVLRGEVRRLLDGADAAMAR